jgi:hypothetical protein
MKARVFGQFHEASSQPALGSICVELVPLDLIVQWDRCGATADWAAGFLSHNFVDRELATGVLSMVINELLENAVKFSADKKQPIALRVAHRGNGIVIETENQTDEARTRAFEAHLVELYQESGEVLFARQIERAANGEIGVPGVGLIVLRKDYGVQLGVKIVPIDDGRHHITVQVALDAEQVNHS